MLEKEAEENNESRHCPSAQTLSAHHSLEVWLSNTKQDWQVGRRVAVGRVTKSQRFPGTVRVSAPKVLHPKDPLSPGPDQSAGHPGEGTPSGTR